MSKIKITPGGEKQRKASSQAWLYDAEMERVVLGSVMLDGSTALRQCTALREEHFILDSHRRIYRALIRLVEEGIEEPSPLIVANYLRQTNELNTLDKVSGSAYLSDLTLGVPRNGSLTYHVNAVIEKFKRRQGLLLCKQCTAKFADAAEPVDDTFTSLETCAGELIQEPNLHLDLGVSRSDVELQEMTNELLCHVQKALRTYLILTRAQLTVIALWVLHAWAFKAARLTAYLHITSAEKRCGKTLLLDILCLYVPKPWKTGGSSTAAVIRKIDKVQPTLLHDETDVAFQCDKEYTATLRRILNTGYHRDGCYTMCVGEGAKMTYQDFRTFCPKAFAGIGKLPDTLADRSITIVMQRKGKTENVTEFAEEEAEAEAQPFQTAIRNWLSPQVIERLRSTHPERLEKLNDRQKDISKPLLAIAEMAGGTWPKKAQEALVELFTGEAAEDDSIAVRLLDNIRTVFLGQDEDPPQKPCNEICSSELCERLSQRDAWPWGDWYGKPLNAHALARLLKPFRIFPCKKRFEDKGNRPLNGYEADMFEEAWERYCPLPPNSRGTNGTSRVIVEDSQVFASGTDLSNFILKK
jgi:hypothetical protein